MSKLTHTDLSEAELAYLVELPMDDLQRNRKLTERLVSLGAARIEEKDGYRIVKPTHSGGCVAKYARKRKAAPPAAATPVLPRKDPPVKQPTLFDSLEMFSPRETVALELLGHVYVETDGLTEECIEFALRSADKVLEVFKRHRKK